MTLKEWLDNGWLKPYKSSREEIEKLLAIAQRDIRDARALGHYRPLQALPLILGVERKADADYLDACRIKRYIVEYQYVGGATDVDANELIEFAETLERDVVDWLKLRHPELAPK